MKKKEVLIALGFTLLATGGGWVWEVIIRKEANSHGFPLKFYWYVMGGGAVGKPPYEIHYTSMIPQWNYRNLAFDFFFWFLVLAMLWIVVKWIKGIYGKR